MRYQASCAFGWHKSVIGLYDPLKLGGCRDTLLGVRASIMPIIASRTPPNGRAEARPYTTALSCLATAKSSLDTPSKPGSTSSPWALFLPVLWSSCDQLT